MLLGIVRVRHCAFACTILRSPLVRASGALCEFPLVAEQVGEEVVAPLGRRGCPGNIEAAADGVRAMTFTKFILPTESLVLDLGRFWFGTDVVSGNACAVSFAKRMTAGNQRDRFFVVHRHA